VALLNLQHTPSTIESPNTISIRQWLECSSQQLVLFGHFCQTGYQKLAAMI